MKIKLLYIILTLFTLLFAMPDKQLKLNDVHVYFAEKDIRFAQAALEIVHKQQTRLVNQYGLEVNPLHIYIADNQDIYRQYSGSNSPVWSAGLASDDKMLVKSPSFSRQSLADFQQTLLHETVHLAVEGIPLPVWFNEGLAQYEAEQFGLHQRILVSHAFWRGDLMRSSEIEYLMTMDQDKAEIVYAQCAAMVDYLIEHFGIKLVSNCLYFTQQTQSFEKGFTSAFLMSPGHFEQLFRDQGKSAYRFYILLDQRNLWILAPIILIAGFILTKIRRRKLLREWESSESEEEFD